jgi:YbbR domain-containing protein
MISILRAFVKSIPTLVLSVALAIAVWISAVTAEDPIQERPFARPVTIERIGQDPALVISNEVPTQVSVTLSAPGSIWDRMLSDRAPVRAWIDLAGLEAGAHTIQVKVDPLIKPAKVTNQSPDTVTVTLEPLVSRDLAIALVRRGEPAIGFQADSPALSLDAVTISGPASQVERARTARVVIDLTQASEDISRQAAVEVLDVNEDPVEGVTVTPGEVFLNQPISQRGGYRNVVVKVVSTGQVASGYRVTSISVFPPTVTVFSANPSLVDRLPGFVENSPVDLGGVRDDLEMRMPLNLPDGVEVVGDETVLVQVGVAAIEGSLTLNNLPVEVTGLPENLVARISPQEVDVIVSGPLPLLENLDESDVQVSLDLSDTGEGTYQLAPRVEIRIDELAVESILPGSIEVIVEVRPPSTPTATRSPFTTPTITPTVTPVP